MTANEPPLLAARGLTVRIGACCAAQAFDLALAPGDRVAVLGRNGAGKSTLLATLAGLRAPQFGQIEALGRPLSDWAPQPLACHRGWLPQLHEDPFAATVLETVIVGRHPWLGRFAWEGEADLALARAALAALGLGGFEHRRVSELSGGERQRVALATVLTQTPRVFLLDEPLSHLDLASQVRVLDHLATLADAGAAVMLVAHDLHLALRWANRIVLLFGEGAWQAGATANVATAEALGRALGHPLRQVGANGALAFLPA